MRYLIMNRYMKRTAGFLAALILLAGCKKKFDEYYERPPNLEPPIYQQLSSRGNFKTLLAVIDKSGYQQTLSNAGYWTLFAPNDAAFQEYFTTNNLSLDKIDSASARALIQYMLVYNAFEKARID